jgi:phospholipid-binding lipoprotein MlaA
MEIGRHVLTGCNFREGFRGPERSEKGRNAVKKTHWVIFFAVLLFSTGVFGEDQPAHMTDYSQHLSALTAKDGSFVDEGAQIEAEFLDEDLDFLDEEDGDDVISVADPLAPWNRLMFRFNDRFYYWFAKPVSTSYKAVVPRPVRSGVENFFSNLAAPVRFGSCLVQGKTKQARAEFTRFFFNTTIGLGGVFDPADNYPQLQINEEDMGQALGSRGMSEGFYVVWPILGPSTFRDTAGAVGDVLMNPISYLPIGVSMGLKGEKSINAASFRIGDYEALTDAAIDPYDAVRDAYLQYRKAKIEE